MGRFSFSATAHQGGSYVSPLHSPVGPQITQEEAEYVSGISASIDLPIKKPRSKDNPTYVGSWAWIITGKGESIQLGRARTIVDTASFHGVLSSGLVGEEIPTRVLTDGITSIGAECDSNGGGELLNGTVTIGINYDIIAPLPTPTNLRLSQTSVGPGKKVTLTWNASSSVADNKLTNYQVWEKSSSGTTLKATVGGETTSYTLTAPTINGAVTQYYVIAVGAKRNSSASATVALTSTYSDVTAPSVSINNASKLFVGESNTPTMTLRWTGANNGTNNSILRYEILKNESVIHTTENASTTSFQVSAAGKYSVRAVGEFNSATSPVAEVVFVTLSGKTVNIHEYATKIGMDTQFTWDGVAAPTGSTIAYTITCTRGGKTKELGTVTEPKFLFNIITVPQGATFTLTVSAVAQAQNGGYSKISQTTSSIMRVEIFTIPESPWIAHYDNGYNVQESLNLFAWKAVHMEWKAPVSPEQGEGAVYQYTLHVRLGEGSWSTREIGTSTTYTYNITPLNEGTVCSFYISVKDKYGSTADYPTFKITKLTRPIIRKSDITEITYSRISMNYDWDFSNAKDDLKYNISLGYNGLYASRETGEFSPIGSPSGQTLRTILDIDLATGKSASLDTMIGTLYKTVITDNYCRPNGTIKIELYDSIYTDCKSEQIIDFTYDFFRPLATVNPLLLTGAKKYYNPKDTISCYFSSANWLDACDQQREDHITYTLSTNTTTLQVVPGTVTQPSYTTTAPNATVDYDIQYTLTATLTYADNGGNLKSTTTKTLTIPIARWTTGIAQLLQIKKEANEVVGKIVFSDWGYSQKHKNLTEVTYQIYDKSQGQTVYKSAQSIPSSLFGAVEVPLAPFTFDKREMVIYAIITLKNAGGNEVEIRTFDFLLRIPDAPLAIRKRGIGVNVAADSFDPDVNSSTVTINSWSDTNSTVPTVAVTNTPTTGTGSFFAFNEGTDEVGRISTFGEKTETSRKRLSIKGMSISEVYDLPVDYFSPKLLDSIYSSKETYDKQECLRRSTSSSSIIWADADVVKKDGAWDTPGKVIQMKIKCSDGTEFVAFQKVVNRTTLSPLNCYRIYSQSSPAPEGNYCSEGKGRTIITFNSPYLLKDNIVLIVPDPFIEREAKKQLSFCEISCVYQGEGELTLMVDYLIKPTINIPLLVTSYGI